MDRCIYLICFDISDRNAQRKAHNLVKAHAIGGQKSFYECLMSQNELHAMVNNIQKAMNSTTDRLHYFQLDPRSKLLYLGTAKQQSIRPFLIC